MTSSVSVPNCLECLRGIYKDVVSLCGILADESELSDTLSHMSEASSGRDGTIGIVLPKNVWRRIGTLRIERTLRLHIMISSRIHNTHKHIVPRFTTKYRDGLIYIYIFCISFSVTYINILV